MTVQQLVSTALICLGGVCTSLLYSQNQPGTKFHIKKAKGEIVLDGVLNETDWEAADVAGDWFMNYPVDSIPAEFVTEVRMTFNDEFLYFSFVCEDDDTPDIVNSLRRDFEYDLNDNVGIAIGPYNDYLNGFFFVITPKGVQMEGTISSGGGNDGFNTFWDNKWYSKVVKYENKWIAELAIPFKSFRYKSDVKEWNIAFDRFDLKHNQKTSWIRTPIQFNTGSLAYSGQLVWDDPIPPAGVNISFIPYVAGGFSQDNQVEPTEQSSDLQVGFDAKIGVTPSMNLDLTFNPDFSQVEVDQQIINLTRFEFRFPERRQFFLENSDLFANAGFPSSRPFFSRRIGLARDSSGFLQQVPILYGARLSGSINKDWRLSVLNMHTKEKLSLGLPAQNYSVATVQRNFWQQSSFSLTFVNKQSLDVNPADTLKYFNRNVFREVIEGDRRELRPNTYNRVVSADLELLSKGNKWYHSSYIGKSFDDFNNRENLSGAAFFRYSTRNMEAFMGSTFVQENFNAEAGFVPGLNVYDEGFVDLFGQVSYNFFPANKNIIVTGPSINLRQTYVPGGILTDEDYSLSYGANFANTSAVEISYNYVFQQLTNDFSLIDSDQYLGFKKGERYSWHTISAEYQSNTRKLFNYNLEATYGGFYNGTNFNIGGEMVFRYQPYGNVSLRFDYNDIKFAEGYGEEKFFLIGPRIDLTFSDKIFLTTFVQYNNLADNINLNARLQWRYQPASDIFIVYTENYLPDNLNSKNRALVFKATYWINI